jgi:carbonic anhydrase/acetyltransferase-like protein (isoleucine patch superfamily)
VLRSGSRLLSGARMGSDCMLLEHTLIMAGDEADNGVVYQGWPADVFRGDRLNL